LHEKTAKDINVKPMYQRLPHLGVRFDLRQQPTHLTVDIFRFCRLSLQSPVSALHDALTPRLVTNQLTSSLRYRWRASQSLSYLFWYQIIAEYA
jgi:hypothetical protein